MKRFLVTGMILFTVSCSKPDEFVPDKKYLYAPQWKVWEIYQVDVKAPQNTNSIADIDSRYKFTDTVTYLSMNRGESYIDYDTNHLSMDSISFTLTTPENTDHRAYRLRTMYTMRDASPPQDKLRKQRDAMFPELEGKFLFMRLENKKKVKVDNRTMTEYLILYN